MITQELINDFNLTLETSDSPLRIRKTDSKNQCEVVLYNSKDLKDYKIVPSDDFYEALENYFGRNNIKIQYERGEAKFFSK